MLKTLIAVIITTFAAIANAGPCANYFGSGTDCYGAGPIAQNSRENAQIGAVIGGGVGALLIRKHPAVGAILGGGVGYAVGRRYDRQEEAATQAAIAQAQAIGWTECNYDARKSGEDQNGHFNQTARSGKLVPGYKGSCN